MKEIKFRQENNGQWHYWGFIDGGFISPLHATGGGKSYQFTGLKDKNGKEIYEGDVVFDSVGKYKAKVEWGRQNTESRWILVDRIDIESISRWANKTLLERIDLEIIGNIYENPNLLI